MNIIRQGFQQSKYGLLNAIGILTRYSGDQGKTGFSLCQGRRGLFMSFSYDGVELPVVQSGTVVHDG